MGGSQRKASRKVAPRSGIVRDAPKRRSNVPVYILLIAAVAAVFHRLVGYEFVDLDDLTYVVGNPAVTGGLTFHGLAWAFTGSYEGYWAPLTWLSYMADVQLFGVNSGALHAINVLLHAASACVLFAALKRLTGAHWRSAIVAALFAVHPLHVESVGWIAERKDALSTFFYFLTLWAYARYVERPFNFARGRPFDVAQGRTAIARYALVVAAFGCALMSKPMVVTLPVVLLLLDAWPLGRVRLGLEPGTYERGSQADTKRVGLAPQHAGSGLQAGTTTWRALLWEKVPLLTMALVVAVVTVVVQSRAGAVASLDVAAPSTRVANALVSCAVYLVKMAWPSGLAALYPYPQAVPAWQTVTAAVLLAGISIAAVRERHRAPYALVGWLWYLVTLVPVLGFIQAGPQARADRYTYVAMTGVSIIATWGLAQMLERRTRGRVALAAGACAVLAAYGVVAFQQVQYWRDSESLFRRALAVTTRNYVAHKALGGTLLHRHQLAEAIAELRRAIALAPRYADAYSDLGNALVAARQPEEAVTYLTEAVRLQPADLGFRVNLGSALYALHRSQAAEVEYREALRLAPDSHEAHSGLGLALAQEGRLEEARRELTAAIRLNPAYADARLNLATVLARMGRAEEAVHAFTEFNRLNPDAPDGHVGLGTLLARQGRMNEAVAELSIAVRMKPGDAMLRSNLGIALVSAGRLDEGTAQLAEAARQRPDVPELQQNLELALAMRATPSHGAAAAADRPARPPR